MEQHLEQVFVPHLGKKDKMVTTITAPGIYGPGEFIQGANLSVSSGDCLQLRAGTKLNTNGFERNFTGPITDTTACGIRVLGAGCQITGTGATRNFPWGMIDQGSGTYIFHHDFINPSYVGIQCSGPNLVCRSVSVIGMTKTRTETGYAIAYNVGAPNCYFERTNARNIYKQAGTVGEGCGFLFTNASTGSRMDYCNVANDVQDVSIGVWVAAPVTINDSMVRNFERGIVGYANATINRTAVILPEPQVGSIGVSLPGGSIGTNWSIIKGYETQLTGGITPGTYLDY